LFSLDEKRPGLEGDLTHSSGATVEVNGATPSLTHTPAERESLLDKATTFAVTHKMTYEA